METVIAHFQIATRIRPTAQVCTRPVPETVTSHAASCPSCHRETRVGLGAIAIIYGGCSHLRGIDQRGALVEVLFTDEAAA